MKKIYKILINVILMLKLESVFAITDSSCTKQEKIGLLVYLFVIVIILALIFTLIKLKVRKRFLLVQEDEEIVKKFNKDIAICRCISIVINYCLIVYDIMLAFITIMYCLEGLGKSLSNVLIYSPLALATQHFIETILLFGVVILLDFIQRKYIKHKINNSKKYDNLDKEILLNYFNYFNEK